MVNIIIDSREPKEYSVLLSKKGASISRTNLTIADYILSDKLAVERKSRVDFENSIIDGRLFEQAKRLSSTYQRSVLIVEGTSENNRVSKPALLGAYSALISAFGISLFFTKSPNSTSDMLYSLANYEQVTKNKQVRVLANRKYLNLEQSQRALIEFFPLIGPNLAKKLLEKFKSPINIFNATEQELESVPEFGKKRLNKLKEIIHSVYKY